MALPQAIQRQAEQAEAAMRALAETPQPEVLRDPSKVPAPPPPAPAPAPVQEVPPPQAPAPAPTDDFRAKYQALQGKYNAEVPRLNNQLQNLTRELETLRAQVSAPKPAEAPPAQPAASPKEVENFGAEMIEMVQRQAHQTFTHMSHALLGQLQALENRLKTVETGFSGVTQETGQTREQLFFSELARKAPDWEQINESAEWLAWLQEVDPVYGAPRQAALDAARERLSAERAAAVFAAFKASRAPAPSPAPRSSLESQIAPSTAATQQPTQQAKPVYTQGFVTKFYMDIQRGNYKGREAEAARIEADINLAASENRIR